MPFLFQFCDLIRKKKKKRRKKCFYRIGNRHATLIKNLLAFYYYFLWPENCASVNLLPDLIPSRVQGLFLCPCPGAKCQVWIFQTIGHDPLMDYKINLVAHDQDLLKYEIE